MNKDMVQIISQRIEVVSFFREYFPEWDGRFGHKVKCPFHDDQDPSFKINDDGSWKCFGCGAGAGGVIKFFQKVRNIPTFNQAVSELWQTYISPPISDGVIAQQQQTLKLAKEFRERLEKSRGWDFEKLFALGLGMTKDGNRLSIPVHDQYGQCINVMYLNVLKTKGYKHTVPFQADRPVGRLWPIPLLADQKKNVILCEGYRDALFLLSRGIAAFTIGASTYHLQQCDINLLDGRDVVIIYDVDDPGRKASKRIAEQILLKGHAAGVKVVTLPIQEADHTDISDWMLKEGNAESNLASVIGNTPYYKPFIPVSIDMRTVLEGAGKGHSPPSSSNSPPDLVPLQEVRSSRLFGKRWRAGAVVLSKDNTTYYVPLMYKCRCMRYKEKCSKTECPLANAEEHTITFQMDTKDTRMIRFIESSDREQGVCIKDMLGVPLGCQLLIDPVETCGVTKVLLGAPMNEHGPSENTEAVQVLGYYFGLNVRSNMTYLWGGYSAKHPKDNSMVAILTESDSMSTTLDSFELTDAIRESLSVFRVEEGKNVREYLADYYNHCARSITGIKERPLIHMAIDLVFFSPVSFEFNQDFLRKGSLDVLVFGDPRTGKNLIADGFRNYYEHGEVVSGENVSHMNLIGGIKSTKKFRGLQWGRFAMRNRDTVIVDEMSAIKAEDIGLLSRVRSEGIADLDKDGIHQKTDALCGILWLSNPRDRRMMGEYQYGVQALKTLIPHPEDISRFDYVAAVASGEVASEVINVNGQIREKHRFTKEACHDLILWVKSRRPDQIQFTSDATNYILREAIVFGKMYSDDIQLTLAENVRFKIAKVAASIAGRIFSCDETGQTMVVTESCAKVAAEFLHELYASETLGYKLFSELTKKFQVLEIQKIREGLKDFVEESGMTYVQICRGFAGHDTYTQDDLMTIFNLCRDSARTLKNLLAKYHCFQRKYQYYAKSRGFNDFLRKEMKG